MTELQYLDKQEFYQLHKDIGQYNISEFHKFFPADLSGKSLLDIGCGTGYDLSIFQGKGAQVYGVDINPEAVRIAQHKLHLPSSALQCTSADKLYLPDESLDYVASNYVLQSISDLSPVFREVHRVMKTGGEFIFLVTHPMRQYFEKKNPRTNYFNQEIVDSVILNHTVVVKEPTHTVNDYLSDYVLTNFHIAQFIELHDPTAEQVEGRYYPGFFIVRAVKK